MLLILHIVAYIKENVITKLEKSYSPPRNSRMGNKLPVLFVKKPLSWAIYCPHAKYSLKGLSFAFLTISIHALAYWVIEQYWFVVLSSLPDWILNISKIFWFSHILTHLANEKEEFQFFWSDIYVNLRFLVAWKLAPFQTKIIN